VAAEAAAGSVAAGAKRKPSMTTSGLSYRQPR